MSGSERKRGRDTQFRIGIIRIKRQREHSVRTGREGQLPSKAWSFLSDPSGPPGKSKKSCTQPGERTTITFTYYPHTPEVLRTHLSTLPTCSHASETDTEY